MTISLFKKVVEGADISVIGLPPMKFQRTRNEGRVLHHHITITMGDGEVVLPMS